MEVLAKNVDLKITENYKQFNGEVGESHVHFMLN